MNVHMHTMSAHAYGLSAISFDIVSIRIASAGSAATVRRCLAVLTGPTRIVAIRSDLKIVLVAFDPNSLHPIGK